MIMSKLVQSVHQKIPKREMAQRHTILIGDRNIDMKGIKTLISNINDPKVQPHHKKIYNLK